MGPETDGYVYQHAQPSRQDVVTYGWANQELGHVSYNLIGTRRPRKKHSHTLTKNQEHQGVKDI